jgi:hypothetical protein
MTKLRDFVLYSIVAVALFGTIGLSICSLVPWYSIHSPVVVHEEIYSPGDNVGMCFDRNALINLSGSMVRELVRVDHDGAYHEAAKTAWKVTLEKGKKMIKVGYRLPLSCKDNGNNACVEYEENTYRWVGHTSYSVCLIKRTVYWESEPFQIRLVDG